MQKCKIKVWDYGSIMHPIPRDQEPKCYEVVANCVNGKEGVFAVFEHPSFTEDNIGTAEGDDGHWIFTGQVHKAWIDGIVAAYQGVERETPPLDGERKEMEGLLDLLIEQAEEGIDNVGSFNGRGSEARAKAMFSDTEDALRHKIRG